MQMKSTRRPNVERTADMRARLMAAARALFVAEGYAAASTPSIVAAAGVTRGALYHHFSDKQAIFQAVLLAEAEAVGTAIAASERPGMSARDSLIAGAGAYLAAMAVPGRVRLLLIDGPAVLGREALQAMERAHGEAALREGLQAALAEAGRIDVPVEPLAILLSALFERAAMAVEDGMAPDALMNAVSFVIGGLFPHSD